MRTRNFLFLAAISIFLASIVTFIFYYAYFVDKIVVFGMYVWVDGHFGINTDKDSINFGRVIPGASGERVLKFENNSTRPMIIEFVKKGEIAQWVQSPDSIRIEPQGEKNVSFMVHVPDGTEFGNYSGKVSVLFKRAARQNKN